jgi:hypothetical protein
VLPSACLNILQRMTRPQHTGTHIVEAFSAAISRLAGYECGDYTLESGRTRARLAKSNVLKMRVSELRRIFQAEAQHAIHAQMREPDQRIGLNSGKRSQN